MNTADYLLQVADDGADVLDARWIEYPANELAHDDPANLVALLIGRPDALHASLGELLRVNFAPHEPRCAEYAHAPELALCSLRRNHFGDVEPGQRAARLNVREGPVDGVVWADQEICTSPGELLR